MPEIIPNWHPIGVHFTIALLSLAAMLYLAAPWLKSQALREQALIVARWNLLFGAGFAVVTAILGWFAFNSVTHDTPSHAAMVTHRNWALAALTLFLLAAGWVLWRPPYPKPRPVFAGLLLVAWATLAVAGWHGGEVVFRYGIGVKSLPKVEQEEAGHDHVMPDEHDAQDHAH